MWIEGGSEILRESLEIQFEIDEFSVFSCCKMMRERKDSC
jgi:hypothetical protein